MFERKRGTSSNDIADARRRAGLSRRALALLAGLAVKTLDRIERGLVSPRLSVLVALEVAIGGKHRFVVRQQERRRLGEFDELVVAQQFARDAEASGESGVLVIDRLEGTIVSYRIPSTPGP